MTLLLLWPSMRIIGRDSRQETSSEWGRTKSSCATSSVCSWAHQQFLQTWKKLGINCWAISQLSQRRRPPGTSRSFRNWGTQNHITDPKTGPTHVQENDKGYPLCEVRNQRWLARHQEDMYSCPQSNPRMDDSRLVNHPPGDEKAAGRMIP